MPRPIDELLSEVLQLPVEDRERIARRLLAGLEDASGNAVAEPMGVARKTFLIQTEREMDARWLGEITDLPGVLSYGESPADTISRVQALALRVLADRLDHGETPSELLDVAFRPA